MIQISESSMVITGVILLVILPRSCYVEVTFLEQR